MPTQPIPRYKVRLKDQLGNLRAEFDDWWHLSIFNRVNIASSANIRINENDSRVPLFVIDGQVEIWRMVAGYTDWYLEYEGLIRRRRRNTDDDGKRVFTASTVGYTDLVDRRMIAYRAAHARATKDTVSETVMKEFVTQNCTADASVANGRILDGAIAGLSVEADGATGSNWSGARSFRNLLGVLQEIAGAISMDFNVVGVGDALYEFRTYEDQLGSDRSQVGLVDGKNSAGNAPVVFSLLGGNMKVPDYEEDRIGEKNAVLVMGQGREDEREVTVELDADAIAISPINQRETTRDARQQEETSELESIGQSVLDERGVKENFTFGAIQVPSTVYGKDYFIGDTVTAIYNVTRHKKIVGIDITVDSPETVEDINLVIGEKYGY